MSKTSKTMITVALVTVIFLFIAQGSRAATTKKPVMKKAIFYPFALKYGQEAADSANIALQALIDAEFPQEKIKLALAQAMQETGAFKAGINLMNDNNFSGIMYINKPGIQKNATKGRKFPTKEGNFYYARFASPKDWAVDFLRILNRSPNFPIQATTPKDFVHRLKLNKYFTAPENVYTKNVVFFHDLLTSLGI